MRHHFFNMLVSIRDTTFVRHRTDSTFDAYELRKLWIDPPPFSEVVSTRLTYSKKILAGKAAKIPTANGMHLVVPDLSVFFDVVQQSILAGPAGAFIDYVADQNVRRGLNLVTNFLTSGHIQADRALQWYIAGENYRFPFHEVFKGTMLGQWRQFREDRSEAVNLFDARLGARRVRLLRLHLLSYLLRRAQSEATQEVPPRQMYTAVQSIWSLQRNYYSLLVGAAQAGFGEKCLWRGFWRSLHDRRHAKRWILCQDP